MTGLGRERKLALTELEAPRKGKDGEAMRADIFLQATPADCLKE